MLYLLDNLDRHVEFETKWKIGSVITILCMIFSNQILNIKYRYETTSMWAICVHIEMK